ncbi:MAG: flagellar biosynthesis anti-sigma factor FlgM [Nitrospirae bacterium]|nr:flagellar biosynthesis anti-sigma factor FlgM [Nitrospirota bacterium]
MKIYSNKPPEKQDAANKAQKSGKADQAAGQGSVQKISPIDKVDLSGKAKGMAEMTSAISQMPEIRTEKVEAIGKSVNDGTYEIDPEKVASKMINEMI